MRRFVNKETMPTPIDVEVPVLTPQKEIVPSTQPVLQFSDVIETVWWHSRDNWADVLGANPWRFWSGETVQSWTIIFNCNTTFQEFILCSLWRKPQHTCPGYP